VNIYKVELKVLDTEHKTVLQSILPALSISLASEVKLSEIAIMMFVKAELRKYLEDREDITIYMTENQLRYNAVSESKEHTDVLLLGASSIVPDACEWHVIANPLNVMNYLNLVSTSAEGELPPEDPTIWFDCQHPSLYVEESSDFDHDCQSTGQIIRDEKTGEIEIRLYRACESVACLFRFPETVQYLKNFVNSVFSQVDFRSKSWDVYPSDAVQ